MGGLRHGRQYVVRVRACSSRGAGPWSAPAPAHTMAGRPAPPPPPTVSQVALLPSTPATSGPDVESAREISVGLSNECVGFSVEVLPAQQLTAHDLLLYHLMLYDMMVYELML